ncbi:hypothetical protein Tco_0870826, partial [Tanacetum coccineum]
DPTSPDYVPGPKEPEQAPPSPIYVPFVPEPVYPEFLLEDDVLPAEEQPLPIAASPTTESPGYIPESDLEEDPKEDPEEDDEEDPEEDPADYPADRGDDRDDDDDAEGEEHLVSADPAAVAYSADQDPYLTYRVMARMSIRPQAPAPFLSEEVAERLLALPTPPPSPLSPYSSPLPQIPSPPLPIPSPPPNSPTYVEGSLGSRAARIRQRDALPSPVHETEMPEICLLLLKSLKENNLFDPVTAKWKGMVQEIVSHDNKINISQLESFLSTLSEADWLFDIGFLSLLFSILGCTGFSASDKFSGPMLLPVLIYVNSTVSKKVKVEKTVPAFKAWSSNLLLKRQQEELDLKGFGLLPIVKGLEFIEPKKVNKKKKLKSITEDQDETPKKVEQKDDFHYKSFEEMKKILKDNLLKRRNLIEDTDNKLDIALAINSDDKVNELFVTLYKDKDLEKDDDDEGTDGDDDDNAPDGDNDDIDEDDDDENDDNNENDENIRNEKEKKNDDEGNKEEVGSENVKDDKVEQKDENVEEEKEKKKISDPSLVVHQMIEDMTKLPFISGSLKEVAHDVPPVDAHKGTFNAVEVPHQKVINVAKDKTVQVIKKEVPKKINAKFAVKRIAKAVDVPPDKVVDAVKKKLAVMTQFKQPRPATKTIKDDYQTPKRGRKRVPQVLEEDLVLSGKRMVNPSFALVSPYFERKTMYTKPFTVAEKKILEYIWSYNSLEGDIIFTGKGLQIECIWFFSLYPEIQLSSNIIDLWSTILNDEDKYRGKQSVTRNIYYSTGMVDLNCDALVVNRHEDLNCHALG